MTTPPVFDPSASANSANVNLDASPPKHDHRARHGDTDWWIRLSRIHIELLTPLVAQLFEKLDDSLFDRSASSYLDFFEGMRVLRRNHAALSKHWFERIDDAWKNLRPQAPGAFRPRLVSSEPAADGNGELSLIDDATLERRLAIDSAVARGASLCRMELPPLLHRLSVLRKGAAVPMDEVPAAPEMLVRSFAACLDDVPGLPVEATLITLKLFDRVVLSAIEHICVELNRSLAQGGVVPQWTWSSAFQQQRAARSSVAPARPSSGQSDGDAYDRSWMETVPTVEAGAAQHYDPAAFVVPDARLGDERPLSAAEQANLTATVRALLEQRRISRFLAASAPTHSGPIAAVDSFNARSSMFDAPISVPELQLHTLIETLASLPSPQLPTSWVGETQEAWDPALLKHELSRSLRQRMPTRPASHDPKHVADAPAPAESAEVALGEYEDVIDMVAMMFGFVQRDQALPAGVQALLSRLQLPYLRLALVDTGMFSDAEHPARILMDRLAEVGKSCTPDNPMLAEAMLKMHSLVGRIVANHDVSRAFFDRECQQFCTWADRAAERAATREREQLAAAEDMSKAEDEEAAARAAATAELPHSDDSTAAHASVDAAESEVSVAEVASESLIEALPVATDVADVVATSEIAMPEVESVPVDASIESAVSDPATSTTTVATAASSAAPRYTIKPVLAKRTPVRWTVGDWIEFKSEAGVTSDGAERAGRGKVSWIGAFTGRTILVKPDGSMWREESRTDLDDLLDREVAFIVARTSLFDRSLQSMFGKLRESVVAALGGE